MNSMKLDSARMTAPRAEGSSVASSAEDPGATSVSAFEQALEGKKEQKDAGDQTRSGTEDQSEDGAPAQALCGDAVLSSLFGGRAQAEAAAELGAPAPDLAELAETVADRILVSDPKLSGQTEVRIMLNDAVLPDTELQLTRGADGMLSVKISTSDQAAHQSLVAAQDSLRHCLESRERDGVRIEISQRSQSENGDANRRSRGYADGTENDA